MSNARWPMGRKSTIMEPDNRYRYLIYTFVLILFLIICKAVYGEEITHAKVKPFENQGQYCFVEVKIVVENDEVIKKEILHCADGREGVSGPSYWELFAQFSYQDVNTPEYCRYYSRPDHVFKSFGKACLTIEGKWENN